MTVAKKFNQRKRSIAFLGSLLISIEFSAAQAKTLNVGQNSLLTLDPKLWLQIFYGLIAGLIGASIGLAIATAYVKIRDRIFPRRFSKPLRKMYKWAGMLLGFALGGRAYYLQKVPSESALRILDGFLYSVQIIGIIVLLSAVWDAFTDNLIARGTYTKTSERVLIPVFRKLIQGMIILTGAIIVGSRLLNIHFETVFASLGIGGIAIALAAKDSVENVFGSLTIVLDMPFGIGDWVRINTTEGIVEQINLRSTRVRTFEDTIVNIPNANLIRAIVENVSARRSRRQTLTVRLSYANPESQIEHFTEQVRAALKDIPNLLSDRAVIRISSLDEGSIGFFIQCHFEVESQLDETALREKLLLKILEVGQKEGIQFVNPPAIGLPTPTDLQSIYVPPKPESGAISGTK